MLALPTYKGFSSYVPLQFMPHMVRDNDVTGQKWVQGLQAMLVYINSDTKKKGIYDKKISC